MPKQGIDWLPDSKHYMYISTRIFYSDINMDSIYTKRTYKGPFRIVTFKCDKMLVTEILNDWYRCIDRKGYSCITRDANPHSIKMSQLVKWYQTTVLESKDLRFQNYVANELSQKQPTVYISVYESLTSVNMYEHNVLSDICKRHAEKWEVDH